MSSENKAANKVTEFRGEIRRRLGSTPATPTWS